MDPHFSPESFTQGAQDAFEMILDAYSSEDKATLRALVDPAILKRLENAIDHFRAEGKTQDNTLISIISATIEHVTLKGKIASIKVTFVSDQVLLIKDKSGNVVEGDPRDVERITDHWTFERNISLKDPNWTLVATDRDDS